MYLLKCQTQKCCQRLIPVNLLMRTVDIGVACAPCMITVTLLYQHISILRAFSCFNAKPSRKGTEQRRTDWIKSTI